MWRCVWHVCVRTFACMCVSAILKVNFEVVVRETKVLQRHWKHWCVCACVLLPVHRVLRQWQSCVDLHFEIEVLNRAVLVSYSQPPC